MAEPIDLGLFPLDLVLLPGEVLPLHLFEPRYRELMADCVLGERPFVLARSEQSGTNRIGCTARFEYLEQRFADGRLHVLVRGEAPVELGDETDGHGYFSAMVTELSDEPEAEHQDLRERVLAAYRAFVLAATAAEPPPPSESVPLSYALAATLDLAVEPKAQILAERRESRRLESLIGILQAAGESVERARVAAERAPTNGKVGP